MSVVRGVFAARAVRRMPVTPVVFGRTVVRVDRSDGNGWCDAAERSTERAGMLGMDGTIDLTKGRRRCRNMRMRDSMQPIGVLANGDDVVQEVFGRT